MTNPRMNERNRRWKRRLTVGGAALFVGLTALIGKQAEQNQTAAAVADTATSTPAVVATASTPTPAATAPPVASSPSNSSSTTSSASSGSTTATTSGITARVHSRTTASR